MSPHRHASKLAPLLLALATTACGDDGGSAVPGLREPGSSTASQRLPAETFQMRNGSDYTIAYPVECAGGGACRPLWLQLRGLTLDDPCNCICKNPLSCERACPPSDGIERRRLAPGAVVEFSWTGRHYEDMGNRQPEGPRGVRCLDTQQLGTGDPLEVEFCWYPSATIEDDDAEQVCETTDVAHMAGQVVSFEVTCEGDCAPRPLESIPDAGPKDLDAGLDAGR